MTVWCRRRRTTPAFRGAACARRSLQGLTFRPLAVTAKDTLDWNKTRPKEELDALAAGEDGGITAEREAEVLEVVEGAQAAKLRVEVDAEAVTIATDSEASRATPAWLRRVVDVRRGGSARDDRVVRCSSSF